MDTDVCLSASVARLRLKKLGTVETIEDQRQRIAALDAEALRLEQEAKAKVDGDGDGDGDGDCDLFEQYNRATERLHHLQEALELLRLQGDEFLCLILTPNPFVMPGAAGSPPAIPNPPTYLIKINGYGQLLFHRVHGEIPTEQRVVIYPPTDPSSASRSLHQRHSHSHSHSVNATASTAGAGGAGEESDASVACLADDEREGESGGSQSREVEVEAGPGLGPSCESKPVEAPLPAPAHVVRTEGPIASFFTPYEGRITVSTAATPGPGLADGLAMSLSDDNPVTITTRPSESVDPSRHSHRVSRPPKMILATFFTSFEPGSVVSVVRPAASPMHSGLDRDMSMPMGGGSGSGRDRKRGHSHGHDETHSMKLKLAAVYAPDQLISVKLGSVSAPPSRVRCVRITVALGDGIDHPAHLPIEVYLPLPESQELCEVIGAHILRFARTRVRQVGRLRYFHSLLSTPYEARSGSGGHESMLMEVWAAVFPDRKAPPRVSKQWQELGFQSNDPGRDFRGMGVLSLYNLHFLATKYSELTRLLVHQSLVRTAERSYPFAAACINVTHMLVSAIGRGGLTQTLVRAPPADQQWSCPLLDFLCRSATDSDADDALVEVFVMCMELLDELWDAMEATYMTFSTVISTLRDGLGSALRRRPPTLAALRKCMDVKELAGESE